MAAFKKEPLADTTSPSQSEGADDLSALPDLEIVDWKKAEIHSNGELAMMENAQEFFQICDREKKGFIDRRDLQHLQTELSLDVDELQNVFDALDMDGNGYLTLEEFTVGFNQFLVGEKIIGHQVTKGQHQSEALYSNHWDQQSATGDTEEHHFYTLMDNLGARNLFEDQREIRSLWTQLRKDEPHLLTHFEAFLAKISNQIQEANEEKEIMEVALKRKAAEYGEEIKHLYEEMEQQITSEKDRMFNKDSDSKSRCQELERKLRVKEQEQEQLTQKHKQLVRQCAELLSEKQVSKMENQRLNEINEELEKDLQHASADLLGAQHQVQDLQEETSRVQEEREMELYRVTEGMERENVSLRKQLDLLREMNKHLRDNQDLSLSGFQKPSFPGTSTSRRQRTVSVADQYTERRLSCASKGGDSEELSDSKSVAKNLEQANGHCHIRNRTEKESVGKVRPRQYLQRIISIEEDPLPQFLELHSAIHLNNWMAVEEEEEMVEEELVQEKRRQGAEKNPSSPRRQPVSEAASTQDREPCSSPDRLFKIIFVGNSSVGKSSVLRRFCGASFCPGMCATVGIDYHVKTVNVAHSRVALQLWDTAGQERFRSVTKQFFRKADGVVLIYDITAAMSFSAVHQWLESVQEEASPGVLILLLGNKTDLESERQVACEEGQRLAKECNLIFYECSASSGVNITEPMLHLARLLKELEDEEKEKTVELGEHCPQQKTCCVR
uniref:EF-hand calcium-binding domain-containing protein 4B n=1 Tax=Pristiophorus japonicus TaxID=55135 RepID=UPI00398F2549